MLAGSVLVLSSLVAAAPSLAGTPGVTISGQVDVDQSVGSPTPITGGTVKLYALTGDASTQLVQTVSIASGDSGEYLFRGVTPGSYRLFFSGNAAASSWLGSPFKDDGTVVTVGNSDLIDQDIELAQGGSITGTVTMTPSSWSSVFTQGWVLATAYLLDPTTGLFDQANKGQTAILPGGSYTISGLSAGQYVVRFGSSVTTPEVSLTESAYSPSSGTLTVAAGQTLSGIDADLNHLGGYRVGNERLAGIDRYTTAVDISQTFFSSVAASQADIVFVASGENYPDALSVSATAALFGSPLLLVQQNGVPSSVTAEIRRLNAPHIVVVGGTGAVSDVAYQQLARLVAAPTDIIRISGEDRYETSRAVAEFGFTGVNAQSTLDAVFIATGADYPDALVAGGAAGYEYAPVVMVNGAASGLDAETQQLLQTLNPEHIYIVGGDAVVSSGIEAQLDTSSSAEVLRLDGIDRYATADAVNAEVFPFADTAFLATGAGYADAMAISAVSGAIGSPLYLTQPTCIPQNTWGDSHALGVTDYFTVGGSGVVSDDVAFNLQACFHASSAVTTTTLRTAIGTPLGSAVPRPQRKLTPQF